MPRFGTEQGGRATPGLGKRAFLNNILIRWFQLAWQRMRAYLNEKQRFRFVRKRCSLKDSIRPKLLAI